MSTPQLNHHFQVQFWEFLQFRSVQSLSCVRFSVTPWTAARQASLSITDSGACPNSCPSSQWCHSTISFSVVPFSSCLQSLPASGFFPMSQFFTSCGQSIGASTLASVLSVNIQDWLRTPIFWIEPQAQFWQLLQSRSQVLNRLELGPLTNTELGKNHVNNNPRRTVIWFKLIKCILCAYLWISYCAMNFTYIIHIWISPVTQW